MTFAYFAAVALIGFCLILASSHIGMLNQGDYNRAIGSMLSQPLDSLPRPYLFPSGFIWSFKPEFTGSRVHADASSLIFWAAGIIQKSYREAFSLYSLALVAKIFLLLLCHVLAKRVAELLGQQLVGRLVIFMALAFTVFYAHHIALLNSFYQEYAFLLFLPLLLLCTLEHEQKTKVWLCCVGAFFCGAAKTQYFYVPLLFLIVMFGISIIERKKIDKRLIAGMLIVQAVCLIPVTKNESAKLNYYHSIYLGSYLVMTPEQLKESGVDDTSRACIGVDAWNNLFTGPGLTTIIPGKPTCIENKRLSAKDVLIPYLKYPEIALKIWNLAMPHHFTINYFHLSKAMTIIVPTNGASYESGQLLVAASELRDKLAWPAFGFIFVLGLVLPFIGLRSIKNPFRAASIFLVALIATQIIISFVGEGIRDLSKHLWAAQYGLDILLLVCMAQLFVIFRRRMVA